MRPVLKQRIFSIILFTILGSAAAAQQGFFPEGASILHSDTVRSTSLLTSWGTEVTADNVHPEYPRPTLVRSDWLNLNGYWDWKDGNEKLDGFTHRILVPFPIESTLSGIARHTERCVYRRTFTIPPDWGKDNHILLHFGAVDWETTVFVNGRQAGVHRGGYTPFSFDITPLIHRSEPNELVVQVFDPSQSGEQPRGKQSTTPSGIWYTASTGIWQTVWLEPLPPHHIKTLQIHAGYDTGHVTILPVVNAASRDLTVVAEVFDGEEPVAKVFGGCDGPLLIRLDKSNMKTWSPNTPHLYQVRVRLLHKDSATDQVESYFALRKIETVRDNAHLTVHLNGKRLFLMGVTDQGYWPDGLYTTPSDEAHLMDIRVAKAMGFNVIRKFQKIEPERWYFLCDQWGMLVWQDMPGGDNRASVSQQQFRTELQRMVLSRSHHPSIMAWTIFNEGTGQHNVPEYIDLVSRLDQARLINGASGWTDNGLGDFNVSQKFPGPVMPAADANRTAIIGLFGGVALDPPPEHRWSQMSWGHLHVSDSESLLRHYEKMHEELRRLIQTQGLAGAFFHQLTDVESECNGLIFYDRRRLKVPEKQLEQINRETIKIGSQ